MVTAAEVDVILQAKGNANTQVRALVRNLQDISPAAGAANSMLGQIVATTVGFVAATGVMRALGAAFDFVKDAAIGFNDQVQRSLVGFENFVGTAGAAKTLLDDIAKFARETPFEFPGLVRAANRLLAMGLQAQDIIPVMTAIGNAAAATGEVSEVAISRISLAIGQMATKGKIQAEEMRQLTEAGVPAWQLLANAMGITTAKLQEMTDKGMVPADKNLRLLIDAMQNRAPNAMRNMSQTFAGAMSNIRDALNQAIGTGFKPFFDVLTEGANRLVKFLQTEGFREFAKNVGEVSAAVVGLGKALTSGDWNRFSGFMLQIGRAMEEVFEAGANAAFRALERLVDGLMEVAPRAFDAGVNIVQEFGRGLLDTAATILPSIGSAIASFVGDYLIGKSPPPKGVLSEIDKAGARLLTEFIQGMSSADLSVLEDMTKVINDILTRMFREGSIEETDIITRLFGSQNALAEIINQFNAFGTVAEDVLTNFTSLLGSSGDSAATLALGLLELAKTERDLQELENQIYDVNKKLSDAERAYQAIVRPLLDAQRTAERYWDEQLRGADATIRKWEDAIAVQERLRRPQMDALDDAEASARLAADQEALAEAQRAPQERRLAIEKQINDERKKAKPDLERIRDLTQQAAEAGRETAQDRLRVAQLTRRVAQDQADIETVNARRQLQDAKDQKDALEDQKRDALDPIKQSIQEATDKYDDQRRLLEDERTLLEDRKTILEAERDRVQEIVDKETARLDGLKLVSDELEKQQGLLDKIAKDAEARAKGGAGKGETRNFGGLGFPVGGLPIAGERAGEGMFSDKESFDFAEKTFKERFTEMLNNIQKWAEDVDWLTVLAFVPGIQAAVLAFGSLFNTEFREKLSRALNNVRDEIGPAVDALGRAIVPGIELLAEGFERVVEWLVKTAIPRLASQAAENAPEIAKGLARWTVDFVDFMVERIPTILSALGDLGGSLLNWIVTDAIPNTVTALVGWTTAFIDWVHPIWDRLLTNVGELLTRLKTWIETDGADDINDKLKEWVAAFVGWVVKIIPPLTEQLVLLAAHITAWIINDAAPKVLEILEGADGLVQAFLKWIGPLLPKLVVGLFQISSKISWWVTTELVPFVFNTLQQVGASIVSGIWQGIKDNWEGLKQDIGGLLKSLPGEALKIIRGGSPALEFVPVGDSAVKGVKKGWEDGMPSLLQAIMKGANDMVKAAGGNKEKWAEAGEAMGTGILEGWQSMFPSLLTMVTTDSKLLSDIVKMEAEAAFKAAEEAANAIAATQQGPGGLFNPGGITGGGALTPNSGNILVPTKANPFPYTPAMDNPPDIRSWGDAVFMGLGYSGLEGRAGAILRDFEGGQYHGGKVPPYIQELADLIRKRREEEEERRRKAGLTVNVQLDSKEISASVSSTTARRNEINRLGAVEY